MGSDQQYWRSVSTSSSQTCQPLCTDIYISSTEKFEVNGLLLYGKNVSMAFGRCPVRSIFDDALKLLVQEQKKVAWLCGKTMPLEDAPQAYKDFEARKVQKIVFKMNPEEGGKEIKAK